MNCILESSTEFKELNSVLKDNSKTHVVFSRNNGLPLDLNYKGEPSILFQELLKKNNGNRLKTLEDKSRIYTDEFIEKYGMWKDEESYIQAFDELEEYNNNLKLNQPLGNTILVSDVKSGIAGIVELDTFNKTTSGNISLKVIAKHKTKDIYLLDNKELRNPIMSTNLPIPELDSIPKEEFEMLNKIVYINKNVGKSKSLTANHSNFPISIDTDRLYTSNEILSILGIKLDLPKEVLKGIENTTFFFTYTPSSERGSYLSDIIALNLFNTFGTKKDERLGMDNVKYVLEHEILHRATVYKYYTDSNYKTQIDQMYRILKDYNKTYYYPLSDPLEFIVYSYMDNPTEFKNALPNIGDSQLNYIINQAKSLTKVKSVLDEDAFNKYNESLRLIRNLYSKFGTNPHFYDGLDYLPLNLNLSEKSKFETLVELQRHYNVSITNETLLNILARYNHKNIDEITTIQIRPNESSDIDNILTENPYVKQQDGSIFFTFKGESFQLITDDNNPLNRYIANGESNTIKFNVEQTEDGRFRFNSTLSKNQQNRLLFDITNNKLNFTGTLLTKEESTSIVKMVVLNDIKVKDLSENLISSYNSEMLFKEIFEKGNIELYTALLKSENYDQLLVLVNRLIGINTLDSIKMSRNAQDLSNKGLKQSSPLYIYNLQKSLPLNWYNGLVKSLNLDIKTKELFDDLDNFYANKEYSSNLLKSYALDILLTIDNEKDFYAFQMTTFKEMPFSYYDFDLLKNYPISYKKSEASIKDVNNAISKVEVSKVDINRLIQSFNFIPIYNEIIRLNYPPIKTYNLLMGLHKLNTPLDVKVRRFGTSSYFHLSNGIDNYSLNGIKLTDLTLKEQLNIVKAVDNSLDFIGDEPTLINYAFNRMPTNEDKTTFEIPIIENHSSSYSNGTITLEKTPLYVTSLINKTKYAFNKNGIMVDVIEDSTLDYHSMVKTINGKITIVINPLRVETESIFHEFGHIYIDMIEDKGFVNELIESLKFTELYAKIAELYPELDEYMLGKEVLTTALGIKSDELFNSGIEQESWLKSNNKSKTLLSEQLGTVAYKIELLAKDLITGNLTQKINTEVFIKEQHQKDVIDLNKLGVFKEILSQKRNDVVSLLGQYRNDASTLAYRESLIKEETLLKDYFTALNKDEELATATALISSLDFDAKMIGILETELNNLDTLITLKKRNKENLTIDDFAKIGNSITKARAFLLSTTRILDLDVDVLQAPFFHTTWDEVQQKEVKRLRVSDSEMELINYINKMSQFRSASKNSLIVRKNKLETIIDNLSYTHNAFVMSNTSNPELQELKEDDYYNRLLNNLLEETTYQLKFNATINSDNEYVSNMTKVIKFNKTYAEQEIERRIRIFNKRIANISDADLQSLIKDGRLIQKYDATAYKVAIAKVKNSNKDAKVKLNNRAIIEAFTVIFDEPYIKERQISKRQEVDNDSSIKDKDAAYIRWEIDNITFNSRTGQLEGKMYGEFKYPKDEFLNKKFSELQANENLYSFYNYLSEELKYLTNHISNSPQYKGYLAAISTEKITKEDDPYATNDEITDIHQDKVFMIPFHYLGFLQDKSLIRIPQKKESESKEEYESRIVKETNDRFNTTFTSFNDIKKENAKIVKQNKENHVKKLDTNLKHTIPLFIESAILNKYANKIKDSVTASLVDFRDFNIIKSNKKGVISQRWKYDKNGKPIPSVIKGADSKAYQHYAKMIEMVFYDNFTSPNSLNNLGFKLKNWTSVTGIGFNPFSAVKNVTYGGYMTLIEAAGSYYFNKGELDKGARFYNAGLMQYFADMQLEHGQASGLQSAIVKKINIIESYNDLLEKSSPELANNKYKRWFNNAAFGMTSMGEHMMQNTVMFSMMESHRIVNGKVMSYKDFTRSQLTDINGMSKADAYLVIKNNKVKEKELRIEFEKSPTVLSAFEYNEGYADIKIENEIPMLSDREYANFRLKVMGVNHKMHGIYNKEDKGTIENSILGQLVMQFRHWAIPGWNKRFGHKGIPFSTKTYWNEEMQEFDSGMYNSFFKIFHKAYKVNGYDTLVKSDDFTVQATAALYSIFKGTGNLISNYRLYYNELTIDERAGVKRTIMELLTILTLIFLGSMIPDDDDEDNSLAYNFLVYQIDASKSEMMTFTPMGLFNESLKITANPTGTWSLMTNAYKTLSAAFAFPFNDEEDNQIKSGYNRGNYKVTEYGARLIPGVSIIKRFQRLDDVNKAYKLWNLPG